MCLWIDVAALKYLRAKYRHNCSKKNWKIPNQRSKITETMLQLAGLASTCTTGNKREMFVEHVSKLRGSALAWLWLSTGLALACCWLCTDFPANHWNKHQKNYTIKSCHIFFCKYFAVVTDFLEFLEVFMLSYFWQATVLSLTFQGISLYLQLLFFFFFFPLFFLLCFEVLPRQTINNRFFLLTKIITYFS